jgi:hypothetical protein
MLVMVGDVACGFGPVRPGVRRLDEFAHPSNRAKLTSELLLYSQGNISAMTNEEMQKTIEFILEQQAQFVTRMQRDEVRLTRLEDAFATLVNIARITDERLDTMQTRLGTLTEKMATLAEAQAYTDQRLSALIDVVERYISRGENGNRSS